MTRENHEGFGRDMGRFDFNTIAMAFLAVVFSVFSLSLLAEGIYHTEVETFGYPIEVADAAPMEAGDDGAAAVEPIAPLMASADPAAGADVFKKCASCHTNDAAGGNKAGPGLYGVLGRPVASHPGYGYSGALEAHAAEAPEWTYAELNGFLYKPKDWVPGTSMGFAGISKVEDRANLVAYLRTLSDSPLPLPDPAEAVVEEVVEDAAVTAEDAVTDDAAAANAEAVESLEEADAVPAETGADGVLEAEEADGVAVPPAVTAAPGNNDDQTSNATADTVTGNALSGNVIENDDVLDDTVDATDMPAVDPVAPAVEGETPLVVPVEPVAPVVEPATPVAPADGAVVVPETDSDLVIVPVE